VWLLAGAAFAVNSLIEQAHRREDGANADAPHARGELSALQALLFSGLIGRHRHVGAVCVRESADDVADIRDLRRLRGRLHGAAEAVYAAETS